MAKLDFSKIASNILSQDKFETEISEYKVFFKKHLRNIEDKRILLIELNKLCVKFQTLVPKTALMSDPDKHELEYNAENVLRKYFNDEVLGLFNKRIPAPIPKQNLYNPENKLWISLIDGLSQSFEITREQVKQEYSYKTNFLLFLYSCLLHSGLHPNILKRDTKVYSRYNFILEHDFKSAKVRQIETKTLLTLNQLQNDFLTPYEKKLPIKIGGKLIPFKNIIQIKITTTLLKDDEINLFAAKNKFIWTEEKKDVKIFIDCCKDVTEELHRNPYLIDEEKERYRNENIYFVHPTRICELKEIRSKDFDLMKLIRLCEELNSASLNNNYITSTILVRAIIDHVPKIFKLNKFSEVANNYTDGTKSFKKSMITLDNSLRNIADNNVHSPVRNKETLPNKTQTDFSPELDVLLSEIVRILK